jgi:DNA ligase (NAD+)
MPNERLLEQKILYHKARYYDGFPEISDFEYDLLEEELRKINPDSYVLNLVGTVGSNNGFNEEKIAHDKKMLSLNKTYSIDEFEKWRKDHEVISTYKIDGVSCSLIFEKGKLVLAKTRGDGSFGENITVKVNWMESVPKEIKILDKIEIRGELFCREKNFIELAKTMEKMNLEKPTSQRNIVAGLMGRKENIELSRFIEFIAFDMIKEKNTFKNESEKFSELQKNYFQYPQYSIHQNKESVQTALDTAVLFMSEGDYQIDGLVFTYNSLSLQDELGETAHHPRYKMAYKFAGDSKPAKIMQIEWSISRNGILTPVAEVEPVILSGATITRVTLHNFGMAKEFSLKSGDQIEIIRSGEVIPKFLSVIKSSKGDFEYPKICPVCGYKTKIEDIRLLCSNERCPGKQKQEILNFIQKIGIEDLSEKRLEEMIKKGLVTEISDLYKLNESDFLILDKTKITLAQKLFNSIQKSKDTDLILFLSSLGLRGGAINKCEKIVNNGYNTIEKILALDNEKLIAIESFAEKSAQDFLYSLSEKKSLINKLLKVGFSFTAKNKIVSNKLEGKKICITGALSEKRSVIEKLIKENGGIVVSGVSKETSILLTNDGNSGSSKAEKAIKLNIPIISEENFLKLVHAD